MEIPVAKIARQQGVRLRASIRMFASYHPLTGINPQWVRARAKDIRGEPKSSQWRLWQKAVGRGWRIVPVVVVLPSRLRAGEVRREIAPAGIAPAGPRPLK